MLYSQENQFDVFLESNLFLMITDNEIANNVKRRVKTTDEIANLKDKKKNDTRF